MLYFLSENGEDESDEDDFEMGMSPEIEAFIEKMIRETIGKKMSRAELDRLMPILKLKFMEDMPGFMDDFDDEFIIPTNKKPKRGFMDL